MGKFNDLWEAYHNRVIEYDELIHGLVTTIFVGSCTLSEIQKEKLNAVGFKNSELEFMEHLNYVFSASNKGIGKAHEYGGYRYNRAGRMMTEKVFKGHMSIEELYQVIIKFK